MDEEYIYIACIAIVLMALIGGGLWMNSAKCYAQGQSFDGVSWGPVQGCMVQHRGRWLPLENIRGFDDRD